MRVYEIEITNTRNMSGHFLKIGYYLSFKNIRRDRVCKRLWYGFVRVFLKEIRH